MKSVMSSAAPPPFLRASSLSRAGCNYSCRCALSSLAARRTRSWSPARARQARRRRLHELYYARLPHEPRLSWQSWKFGRSAGPDDRRSNLNFFGQNFLFPLVQVAYCFSRDMAKNRLENRPCRNS